MTSACAKIIPLRRRPFVIARQWLLCVVMPSGLLGISVAAGIESDWNWRAWVVGGPLAALGVSMFLMLRPLLGKRTDHLVLAARTLTLKSGARTQECEWHAICSIEVVTEAVKGYEYEVLAITLDTLSGAPYRWISLNDIYTTSLKSIAFDLNTWRATYESSNSSTMKSFDHVNVAITRDRRSLIVAALGLILLGPFLAFAMAVAMTSRRHFGQKQP